MDVVRCVPQDLGNRSRNILKDLKKRMKRFCKTLEEYRKGVVIPATPGETQTSS
jgi:hypothetical protein